MKRVTIIILAFLLLWLPVQAQEPNWPDWLWDNDGGLSFPHFPPGEYPVEHFGVPVTLTVSSDGNLFLSDGGQFYVLGTSLSCLDAACNSVAINTIFVDPLTMSQSYSAIILHWDQWYPTTPPAGTPTSVPPTGTPRPTSTPHPTVTPMPTPVDCPPESISQRPPTVETLRIWPPNPVVKGQGGQGLSLTVRVTSYPVIHRWWTREERSTTECAWHGDSTTGQPDESVCECTPDGSEGCWPGWGWETTSEWYCQEHVEIIPDPIQAGAFQAHARLHKTSKEWIQTNLASKYPGARVRHPDWDVQGQPNAGGCLGDGRCILETVAYFPFEDPGWYTMWVDGWTVGTRYTPPRTYHYNLPDPQPVYLMDTTLIPDW